jgi:hypothetical protein
LTRRRCVCFFSFFSYSTQKLGTENHDEMTRYLSDFRTRSFSQRRHLHLTIAFNVRGFTNASSRKLIQKKICEDRHQRQSEFTSSCIARKRSSCDSSVPPSPPAGSRNGFEVARICVTTCSPLAVQQQRIYLFENTSLEGVFSC